MSDQQELRQRREALAHAVNSHDLESVRSFIDPSFVGKGKGGSTLGGYQGMIRTAEQIFAPGTEYQETVEIEGIEANGDSAKLVVQRRARGYFSNPWLFWILFVLGSQSGVRAVTNIVSLLITGQSRQELWESLVGLVVCVVMIWLAFVLGRGLRQEVTRAQETWRMIDGQWMLVEEQQL